MPGILRKVWDNRSKIMEGITNTVFIRKEVERIADQRMRTCNVCPHQDKTGETCIVPGTAPCCKLCGCSLKLKIRALSAACDDNRWPAVLSPEEEDQVNAKLND